jgi:hypothetical protein
MFLMGLPGTLAILRGTNIFPSVSSKTYLPRKAGSEVEP